jgi:hypothetical protein
MYNNISNYVCMKHHTANVFNITFNEILMLIQMIFS